MNPVHFMVALPSLSAGFVSGTARQPSLCFGKFITYFSQALPQDAYMLSHHYSARIQLGSNHFVFTALHNRTQPLLTTDEEVPVLKNLQSKIRCNTTSEGKSREG